MVLTLYIAMVAVQLLFWVGIFYRLKGDDSPVRSRDTHSILACFKNEKEQLPVFMDSIVKQGAQIIVLVDDFSTDDYQLESIPSDKINIVPAKEDRPGKKRALYDGMNACSDDLLCLTDVDCSASSDHWSALMVEKLDHADAVLGYGPLTKEKGSIPTFARYETYLTAIQYLSYAQIGWAYMGVGRNMAVKRHKALPILKEIAEDDLASGDDDLLIQGLSKDSTIETLVHSDAFMYSDAPETLRKYVSQKSRHMSTSVKYKFTHQVALSLFAGSHIGTYILYLTLAVGYPIYIKWACIILLCKWIIQTIVNKKLMSILDEEDLLWKFPFLDIATFVFYIIMTPLMVINNKNNWN